VPQAGYKNMTERDHLRIPFKVKAIFKYNGSTVEGSVQNLSMQGMFVRISKEIPADTKLAVSLHLTGDTSRISLKLTGNVIRTGEDGIAVGFINMDLDSFIVLRNIVVSKKLDKDKIIRDFENAVFPGDITD